ncbi:hypothetical protein ACIBBD_15545 [Streptomyces sp. NPDC051315]|uniref:hypothetical protein n=1 Tax=Streptomyces sp. NPDC051315 TaxID=3365650 RepID=UPI00378AC75F
MDRGAIRRRRSAVPAVLAVLITSVLLALVTPGSARAAASPCPGRKVKTVSFSTGAVHVYKSRGSVCAFTLQKNPGTRKKMSVSVQARGHRPNRLEGSRTRRIGPVDVYAGNRPVLVTGSVGRASGSSGWFG